MAGVRNILLKIVGETSDAQRALETVKRDLRDLSKQQATAHVDVQIDAAERQLLGFRRQLQDLSQQKATPEVQLSTERVSRRILTLEARLARLGARRVEIDVDVRRGTAERTVAALGRVESSIAKISRPVERIPLFIGRLLSLPLRLLESMVGVVGSLVEAGGAVVGFFAKLGGAIVSAFQTANDVVRGLVNGTQTVGQVVGSVVSAIVSALASLPTIVLTIVALGAAIAAAGAIASGFVIAINAIVGGIIALGAALVALVASLAAAVAGLAALAVAFGAVLAPVVLVGIALIQRFTAVLAARKAHEQEVTAAIQQQKTAEDQRKTALDQVKQATTALAQATVDARKAMAQAAIDQHNAELALDDSKLGLKGARLGVLDAKKALRDLLTTAGVTGQALDKLFKQFSDVHVDPTKLQGLLGGVTAAGGDAQKTDPLALAHAILNVQTAQQGVKDAINQTAAAERALGTATKRRADFARRGLDAYAPYRQALGRVTQAEDKLRTAQDKVSRAQVVYDRKLKALSQTERGFFGQLDPFISKLKDLAKVIAAPIFRGLESAMGSLTKLFSNSGIQSALQSVGTALGNFFARLGRELTSKDWRSAFEQFGHAAARMIDSGGRGFGDLLTILRDIATTALPALESAVRKVSGWLHRVAGQPGKIRDATNSVIEHFKTWAGLAWQVLRAVVGIFRGAAGPGKSLAKSLTTIVKNFADWANSDEGQKKIHAFFVRMVRRAKEIVRWIKDAAIWLKTHLPSAAAKAKEAFDTIYKVLKAMKDTWKWMIDNPIANAVGLGSGASGGGHAARSDLEGPFSKVKDPKRSTKDRVTIGLSLLDLEISVSMRKQIEKILRQLGYKGPFPKFATGGTVAGPVGASQLAVVHGGEEIIRASMAERFRPQLQAINAGAMSVLQTPAMASAGGGDIHHHYHVPTPAGGGNPDPRSTLEHIHRLITLKG